MLEEDCGVMAQSVLAVLSCPSLSSCLFPGEYSDALDTASATLVSGSCWLNLQLPGALICLDQWPIWLVGQCVCVCRSLGGEDPLEEEMATHSSILAWRILRVEEPGGLLSIGSQRVGHD